jgi:hypothetical protein
MLHPATALFRRSPLVFRLFMSGVSTPDAPAPGKPRDRTFDSKILCASGDFLA